MSTRSQPAIFAMIFCLALPAPGLGSGPLTGASDPLTMLVDVPDDRDEVVAYEKCLFEAPPDAVPASIGQSHPQAASSFERTPESVYRIVNRFHVVRRSDGTGGVDESLIDAMMLDLNHGFRDTPFVFVREPGVTYVDNDSYYENFPTFSSAFPMLSEHFQLGVMSWYVTPNINGAVAGTWIRPASAYRGILMAYNTIGSPSNIVTPTHEMAHIFQVYHPFETALGVECTSGSNCASAGDLVCDTPASPGVHGGNTTATGLYFGNQSGPCVGDPVYQPNPRLYMDAGWPAGHILRNQFSQGEIDRAVSFLSPSSQYPVADLVGPLRPEILVDCDGNGVDDIDEILSGAKADLGRDLMPDVCQVFAREGDLIVTGMSPGPNNRLRYYDRNTGAWRGDLWNGMSYVHQARAGPDGLVYIARLTIIQRVSLETGRTVDNFIDGVRQGAGTFVDLLFEPSGNILVLDNATRNVRRFNGQSGQYMGVFFSIQAGGNFSPKYMEYGPDGNIYIVGNGAGGNVVVRHDAGNGAYLGPFVAAGAGDLGAGQGLVFHDDGYLYVSNGSANNVLRYDAATGAFDREFVASGSGGLNNPHSLRFGPDGNLYVASRGTDSVKRYDGATGAYLDDFVAPGAGGSPGTGGLDEPAGLLFAAVDGAADADIGPGMSGAWTNLETLGQGMFLDVIERQQRIFMGWFTYESDGVVLDPGENEQRWLVAIGPYQAESASLQLLAVDGGTFNGPEAVTETPVGVAQLHFSSATGGAFSYTLDAGPQGVIPLNRLLPVRQEAAPGPFAINAGMAGSFANPDIPGQGIFVDVDTTNHVVFLAWFTYGEAAAGQASVVGYPSNRWFVAAGNYEDGSNVAELVISETEGGVFDQPGAVSESEVGGMTLTFHNCMDATLQFAFDDGGPEGQIELTRLTPADACEAQIDGQNQVVD